MISSSCYSGKVFCDGSLGGVIGAKRRRRSFRLCQHRTGQQHIQIHRHSEASEICCVSFHYILNFFFSNVIVIIVMAMS